MDNLIQGMEFEGGAEPAWLSELEIKRDPDYADGPINPQPTFVVQGMYNRTFSFKFMSNTNDYNVYK